MASEPGKRKKKVGKKAAKKPAPPVRSTRAREDTAPAPPTPPAVLQKKTKAERIEHIMRLMVDGRWVTGKTGPQLVTEWGFALDTIERDAAEASRRIRDLVSPREREELKARYLAKLEGVLDQALAAGKFEAAKGLLELEGKTLGHFEPEKVEVSGNLSDLLQLGLAPSGETPG